MAIGLSFRRPTLVAFLLAVGLASGCMMGHMEPRPRVTPAPTVTPGGQTTVSFKEDIRPLLINECGGCHGGQVGLYVDSFDTLMAGSSRAKVVVPGNPDGSLLVRRLNGDLQPQMPLGATPLSQKDIEIIATWIREGAPNN